MLVLAILSTVVVLVAFTFTTLVDEPGDRGDPGRDHRGSIGIDLVWKRARDSRVEEARPI